MRKPSFFEKLTGSISPDNYDDLFEGGEQEEQPRASAVREESPRRVVQDDSIIEPSPTTMNDKQWEPEQEKRPEINNSLEEEEQEGELSVDIYQTPDAIVVKALVAGVIPNSIDISLTRDMITIRGNREEHKEVEREDYFYKELYWGAFARTILLPEEIDVDEADASTNHGILVIRLPKINKERKTKLKVKAR